MSVGCDSVFFLDVLDIVRTTTEMSFNGDLKLLLKI